MTTTGSHQELVRFLEDRFACAQACSDCARICALRASLVEPDGGRRYEITRRKAVMCAEICDATCRLLAEQNEQDEGVLRVQLEWCRSVCLETAQALDARPGDEEAAEACRTCARTCTDFMSILR